MVRGEVLAWEKRLFLCEGGVSVGEKLYILCYFISFFVCRVASALERLCMYSSTF